MDGLFCLLNLARLHKVRRLKPLPCYRRATAEPNLFEFGTAVVRRLEQALKRQQSPDTTTDTQGMSKFY